MESLIFFYSIVFSGVILYLTYSLLQLVFHGFQKDKCIYQKQTGKYEDVYFCEDCKKVQSIAFCWHSNLDKWGGYICGYCDSTNVIKRIAKYEKALWRHDFIVIGGKWKFFEE